jgi:small subunit ribosomal protein S4
LVSHGHVLVNGRRADIGSMVLRTGTRIRLTARAGEMACTQRARGNPRLPLPSFLAFEAAGPHEEGVLTSIPSVEHVPFEFNPALVAEYYARRGVK